jgi:hypothetical protein
MKGAGKINDNCIGRGLGSNGVQLLRSAPDDAQRGGLIDGHRRVHADRVTQMSIAA